MLKHRFQKANIKKKKKRSQDFFLLFLEKKKKIRDTGDIVSMAKEQEGDGGNTITII